MGDARELGNALRFFREVSGIPQEPVATLPHRLAVLRMVYALTPHHVPEMLAALKDSGLDVGQYNVDAVSNAVTNSLFEMTPAAWVRFVAHLQVDNCPEMLQTLAKNYDAGGSASPVLSFRELVRNSAGHAFDEHGGEHLTLFMHVYNGEVRTSELLAHVLPTMGVCNVSSVAHSLNDKQHCVKIENMIHDLVCLLGNTSPDRTHPLLAGMREVENTRRTALSVRAQLPCARISIVLLRAQLQREEAETSTARGAVLGAPPGLPIEPADWTRLSQSQRQVVLLVCLMRADAVHDLRKLLAHVIPAEHAEAFEGYSLQSARQEQALEAVLPALHRLVHVVEFANARVKSVLESFKDACLQHTLGNEQQQLLPLATLAQLYLLAHFPPPPQAAAYRNIAAAFNSNIPLPKKYLRVPETMSEDLSTRMRAFTSANKLAPIFVQGVLQSMCV